MSHPFRKFSSFQVLPNSSSSASKSTEIKTQLRYLVTCDYGSNNPSSLNVQSGEIVIQTISANETEDETTEKVLVARLNGTEGYVPRSILERLNQAMPTPNTPNPLTPSPSRNPAVISKAPSFKSSTGKSLAEFEAAILSDDIKSLPIDDPSNIVIGEIDPQTSRPTIKAATLERLIDLLISEYCYPAFRSCFLVSFRFYGTPEDLLKSIRQLYRGKMKDDKEKKTYARIIGILKFWIEAHGKSDFPCNSPVRASLESFIVDELSSPQLKKLLEKLDKASESSSQAQSKSSSSSASFPPLDKLHTWSPAQTKTFVEQLTCLVSEKYRAIPLYDFFLFATSTESNLGNSIADMRKVSSFLHDWILWEIVRKAKSEELAPTLENIASIATQLFELHNYVAVKEIIDVIYDPRISQLTKSSSLQPSSRSALDKIRKTFVPENNFQVYLTQLESFSPCVPWIDYHLFAIKSYDVEMKNTVGNLINFEKWMKIYQESQTMQQYQISYNSLTLFDTFESYFLDYDLPPQSRIVEWLGVILQQKEEESIMAEFIERNSKMKAQLAALKIELGIFESEEQGTSSAGPQTPREKQTTEQSEQSEPREAEAKEEMSPLKSMALLNAPPSNENRRKISKQLAAQLEESKAVLHVILSSLEEERPEEALRRKMSSLQQMFDQKNSSLQKAVDEAEEKIANYEQQLKSQEQ